jgi:2-oxoisovalerate dehydrogenase E1 component
LSTDRIAVVEGNLDAFLAGAAAASGRLGGDAPLRPDSGLTVRQAVRLFEDQVLCRALDVAARRLKQRRLSYYTISSAGHEQNGCLGALLRPTDPCFLHYRAGALMMARARQVPGATPLFDTLLSLCASREDPIAQGRHKAWGSRALWVPPQTSTIASHLPKAVGAAFTLARARRVGIEPEPPPDALVCCTFGDATINHATALAGINSARYAHRRGNPLPILFVCEDNGIGISVDTPRRWVRDAFGSLPHLRYIEADGDVDEVWDATAQAIDACRKSRGPVFLHLRCVRLWGHAGSDVESAYHSLEQIEAIEAQDPILRNARRLVASGAAAPEELRAIVADTRARVAAAAEEAAHRGHLADLEEVVAPLAPYRADVCRATAEGTPEPALRHDVWAGALPEDATAPTKRTLAAHINAALADEMARHPEIVVFGEDVGRKGGVYYVTAGLQRKFGIARVFDTLLDETTILGVAQGAAHLGLLPIPEIQYLAYVHNAIDQLRGEACSLSFFSGGQFVNPMVVRIASFAHQKGFGGHFHNANSIGALRDIPGLVLTAPARGDDAARMLRGCIAMALEFGRVVCFLEPIALYHERDLHEEGDGQWLSDYPPPGSALLPGDVGLYGEGDVLLVSYANGLRLSLRAARALEREHGIATRVLDLRWLNPLPLDELRHHADECGSVVVVDECRATGGGIADAVTAHLGETGYPGRLRSVRAADSYVPLGPSAAAVLVNERDIVTAVREVAS